jgi:hypothetical protein
MFERSRSGFGISETRVVDQEGGAGPPDRMKLKRGRRTGRRGSANV